MMISKLKRWYFWAFIVPKFLKAHKEVLSSIDNPEAEDRLVREFIADKLYAEDVQDVRTVLSLYRVYFKVNKSDFSADFKRVLPIIKKLSE